MNFYCVYSCVEMCDVLPNKEFTNNLQTVTPNKL